MFRPRLPLLTFIVATCVLGGCNRRVDDSSESTGSVETIAPKRPGIIDGSRADRETVKSTSMDAAALAEQSQRLDQTLWANEVLAQKHEAPFVRLSDELRTSADKYTVLKRFPFQSLIVGQPAGSENFDWGVVRTHYRRSPDGSQTTRLDHAGFVRWLERFQQLGFDVVQSEWHHSAFQPPQGTAAARSTVSMEVDLAHPNKPHSLVLTGELIIEWTAEEDENGSPVPLTIDATQLDLTERESPPIFSGVLKVEPTPDRATAAQDVMPLIVQDLNDDGLPEIVLGGANAVLWNRGDFRFERANILDEEFSLWHSGVMADFTGDGVLDLVGVDASGQGIICVGQGEGKFASPRPCWQPKAVFPSAITAGDVDLDGDLDLWLAQYKPPYNHGQMPTPYYDANDGYPSYLLLNDGTGNFHDNTAPAGLSARRHRRTYSASFADLDQDRDLDLLVVSDFSGLDIHQNDGSGRFREVTDQWTDHRHAFGMSHAFGDFDGDGALDVYMVGMSSTTARRLDRLGLGRDAFPEYTKMRAPMTYGNRLLLARDRRFVTTPLNDSVARAGWAWGCSAFDFDNDGDDDLYVANGHISGKSSRDYCTRYWCHDVYVGNSSEDPRVARFLTDDFRPPGLRGLNDGLISWNGYEHNRLFMNVHGDNFINVGFPMGVAYEFDSRCVVTPDLDADGRPDLLLVKQDWVDGSRGIAARQSLLVLKNDLQTGNHWIGVHLRPGPRHRGPVGARVAVHGPWGTRQRIIVTGDSYYSQQPATVHFGLGQHTNVERIVVTWPYTDQEAVIERPRIDQYHVLENP